MSDLLILLSTLGGIFVFGAVGFIVGPIVAALFVTIWHIYGETFADWLPAVPITLGAAPLRGPRQGQAPRDGRDDPPRGTDPDPPPEPTGPTTAPRPPGDGATTRRR
jgi:hypothetical protein